MRSCAGKNNRPRSPYSDPANANFIIVDDCERRFFIQYDNATHSASRLQVTFVTNKTANPSLGRSSCTIIGVFENDAPSCGDASLCYFHNIVLSSYIYKYMDMCVPRNRIFDANFFQILTLSVIINVDCCFILSCTSRRCSTRNISIDYASSNFRSLEVVIASGERNFFSVCSICMILRNACNLTARVELTRSVIPNWMGWYSL